jgi:hypothetical protein
MTNLGVEVEDDLVADIGEDSLGREHEGTVGSTNLNVMDLGRHADDEEGEEGSGREEHR